MTPSPQRASPSFDGALQFHWSLAAAHVAARLFDHRDDRFVAAIADDTLFQFSEQLVRPINYCISVLDRHRSAQRCQGADPDGPQPKSLTFLV